jgi:hypothetical protein
VVAEITLAHLTQFPRQKDRSLAPEEAMAFLNQNGRAYEIWKRMMQAGEDYTSSLRSRRVPRSFSCARPLAAAPPQSRW